MAYYGELPQIEIEQFSDSHYRITRVRDGGQMDVWPHTGKAKWRWNDQSGYFTIHDLDRYMEEKFCPKWWEEEPFGQRPVVVGPSADKVNTFNTLLYKTNSIYKPKTIRQ